MMSSLDENKVIDTVKQGFIIGMMPWNPGMEGLMRSVYRAGYKQREIEELEKKLEEINEARDKISDTQGD